MLIQDTEFYQLSVFGSIERFRTYTRRLSHARWPSFSRRWRAIFCSALASRQSFRNMTASSVTSSLPAVILTGTDTQLPVTSPTSPVSDVPPLKTTIPLRMDDPPCCLSEYSRFSSYDMIPFFRFFIQIFPVTAKCHTSYISGYNTANIRIIHQKGR